MLFHYLKPKKVTFIKFARHINLYITLQWMKNHAIVFSFPSSGFFLSSQQWLEVWIERCAWLGNMTVCWAAATYLLPMKVVFILLHIDGYVDRFWLKTKNPLKTFIHCPMNLCNLLDIPMRRINHRFSFEFFPFHLNHKQMYVAEKEIRIAIIFLYNWMALLR